MNKNLIQEVPDIQMNAMLNKEHEEKANDLRRALEDELDRVKGYNQTLDDFSICYKNFIPYNKVLIRVFLREPQISESGFWMPSTSKADVVEVQRRAGSGDRYTQNIVESPFKFDTKAIIVSAPTYALEDERYKPGTIVCIEHLKAQATTFQDDSTVIQYAFAFVHPDYGDVVPPQNYQSEHYGYALVPTDVIKGKIA